jgi:hypothetical protein
MSKEYLFDEVSVGMDGEGFLVNPRGGGVVPVVGLLGGVKGSPTPCDGGGFLEDCVAWEINPTPVTITQGKAAFVSNVVKCLDAVKRRAAELDLEIDISTSKLFKKKDLSSEQALISGCSDSFDCWNLRKMEKVDLSLTNHRFASGDIHVGFPWAQDKDDVYARVNVARMLDIYFGLTEITISNKSKRNEFYGKAGIHRPTAYGVEYKTCGNFWMGSKERIGWAFDTAVAAVTYVGDVREKNRPGVLFQDMKEMVVGTREQWSKSSARELLSAYHVPKFPG